MLIPMDIPDMSGTREVRVSLSALFSANLTGWAFRKFPYARLDEDLTSPYQTRHFTSRVSRKDETTTDDESGEQWRMTGLVGSAVAAF
jgi:hypothetical protein